jgi:glycerophosphoryl diester phosphodiesterase
MIPFRGSFVAIFLLTLLDASLGNAQMITAHRGASYDAPENTLAAFNLAWSQDADAIEGDFYLSSDRKIVCIHDKDTLRTAGVKLVVEQTAFDKLRTLEVGAWKNQAFKGEQIPTFEEVLATVPAGRRFVIELKTGIEIVPMLDQELKRLKPLRDSLLIISFDAASIAKCKQLMPDIRAHWLTDIKLDAMGSFSPQPESIAKTVQECKADGVGMKGEKKAIDQKFIDALSTGNCREFHVWTVDDAGDANYFQSLGAVGITTNRPAFINASMRPRNR